MIHINMLNTIKNLAELQIANEMSKGIFGILEGENITWQISSSSFNIKAFETGKKVDTNNVILKANHEKKTVTEEYSEEVYGIRLKITAIPIINDDNESVGVFYMLNPIMHDLNNAFKHFAPIVDELFPDGAYLTITDKEKITEKFATEKFDIPEVQPGFSIVEDPNVNECIRTGKSKVVDIDTYDYGKPLRVLVYPYFNEKTKEADGVVMVTRPKETELSLRNMSIRLKNSLSNMAATVEELAASASEIHVNEQKLSDNIKEITLLSEQINEVSNFIHQIANQTKMLGLNASIEAARAGDFGKGFGVVANEIRNLSEQSKNTISKINNLTHDIISKVEESNQKSQSSLVSSQEQAAATQEVSAAIQEITSLSEELNEISGKI
ncbi:methyl-accepting chemotaxis protein [Clostridium sp. C2-6-12]|uniref:methyl-accepting chemotaxis protein n=1 Tax=Clostridium sp. C2-6-12 TaxID=2698832 RepID=UPI001371ABE4|nr:methyl-accepting chemotaxis protein [Clostridium sp. C2-6-12]